MTLATDKPVGRMLGNYAAKLKVHGHPLVGPFNSYVYKRSQKLCCVGAVANIIRLAIKEFGRTGILPSRWKITSAWRNVLPENSVLSAHTWSVLYPSACADSHNDWINECNIFRASLNSNQLEDWAQSAWDDPYWERADLRRMHLGTLKPTNGNSYASFGDGGYDHGAGAMFSAQV